MRSGFSAFQCRRKRLEMAKRAVDVAVTLKRSLRFTLRTAEEFVSPTLRPARGQEDASAALLPPRRTSAGGPAFAPQGGPARSENLDKGEGVIALQGHCIPAGTHFVDAASSPEDVLAVMVGKVVAGKTTFAIPIDMLVSSKPSAPDSTSAIEVDEGVQLENPRREADESNDADSNPLLNAIVSSVSAMQLTPSSDNGSLNAVAMHGIAHSRSVSLKEAASVALKPTDLSRLDFQKQQEQFHERSRLGAPSLSRSAAHDSAPPLSLIDRCVELAANWKLPELTSFLEQHHKVINPASLRCGDEQATLLHFVATHTPSPMSMRHANSKGNDRQPHLQDQCFQLVRYLVDVCGVPINGGARNGATPLHWAAGHGNVSVPYCFVLLLVVPIHSFALTFLVLFCSCEGRGGACFLGSWG